MPSAPCWFLRSSVSRYNSLWADPAPRSFVHTSGQLLISRAVLSRARHFFRTHWISSSTNDESGTGRPCCRQLLFPLKKRQHKAKCKRLTSVVIYKPARWLIQHYSSGHSSRPADYSCKKFRETIGKMTLKHGAVLCFAVSLVCIVVDARPSEEGVKSEWVLLSQEWKPVLQSSSLILKTRS